MQEAQEDFSSCIIKSSSSKKILCVIKTKSVQPC